ncbi:4Fe-4S binding domain-containing protein [Clostridium cavendishii DSM 21758]|uniref:4Fe-4S binding domain-containing protein n=1 Tax=Clostridium cavendishii DSM 21758 TaxID=1121302 RepID=A0A1M6GRS3_9CLOT|nr:4Fe-4S binding protein [Clostridium cavendishii]SHJ12609.1 4Fe-4S binding domain-containing protein [Clostridium cavendishii DSM 21758]
MKLRKSINFLSFILLPITLNYFAPVLIVQSSLENTFTSMHIIYGVMFLIAIFFGGVWCSYICPFGALQELIPNTTRLKRKLPNLKWVTGSIFLILIFAPLIMYGFQKISIFYHMVDTKVSVSSFHDLVRYYIIVGFISLITIGLGKRTWCRYICPMYIFNYLGIKLRSLLKLPSFKIECKSEKCTQCKRCNKSCLMGLDVADMVKHNKWNTNECIECGECLNTCKNDVFKIKFKK